MSITITAAENRSMDELAELAGRLAAIVEWCVENEGECLGDHPHNLTNAKAVLAKAKARYDSAS